MKQLLNSISTTAKSWWRGKKTNLSLDVNKLARQMVKAKIPLEKLTPIASDQAAHEVSQANKDDQEKVIQMANPYSMKTLKLNVQAVRVQEGAKRKGLQSMLKEAESSLPKAREDEAASKKAYTDLAKTLDLSATWELFKGMSRWLFSGMIILLFGCEAVANTSLMLALFRENVLSTILLAMGSTLGLSYLADLIGEVLAEKKNRSLAYLLMFIGLSFTSTIGYGRIAFYDPATVSWAHLLIGLAVPVFFFIVLVLISWKWHSSKILKDSINTKLKAALIDREKTSHLKQDIHDLKTAIRDSSAHQKLEKIRFKKEQLETKNEKAILAHRITFHQDQKTREFRQSMNALRILDVVHETLKEVDETPIPIPEYGPLHAPTQPNS